MDRTKRAPPLKSKTKSDREPSLVTLIFLLYSRIAFNMVFWLRKGKRMDTSQRSGLERRRFIQSLAVAGSGLLLGGLPIAAFSEEKKEIEVSPVEDLMREHGGLNRILLIYEECQRRLQGKQDFNPKFLEKSAEIIRNFIEGYHEKLEEEHIFPRLEKAGKLVDLVKTLREQHKAGREVTATILKYSTASALKNESDRKKLSEALHKFTRMYRPHEAREDTILFPEFKTVITPKEYDVLGDKFEDREHELFGKEGFEGIVVQIADIEKGLGIYDLGQFTPK